MKPPKPRQALRWAPAEVVPLGPGGHLVEVTEAGRGGEQSVSDYFMQLMCEATPARDGIQSPLRTGSHRNTADKCLIKC